MNRFINISALVSVFVIICGCSKEIEFENKEIEIPIPSEGYIFFSSDIPDTRAMITTDNLEAPFSVIGYRYPTTWESEGSQAKQDKRIGYTNNDGNFIGSDNTGVDNYMGVFYHDTDESDENVPNYSNSVPTQVEVKWSNGAHSYKPLQYWEKNLKYAFFAWYPSSLIANGGSNIEGNPYITYTLPSGTDRDARKSMSDVLTAHEVDYTKSQGMRVSFEMNHRLAALDLYVVSLVNAKALKDTYGKPDADNYVAAWDETTLSDDAEVIVSVSDVSLTLANMKTTARIELNPEYVENTITAEGATVTYTYTGFNGADNIGYYSAESIVGDDEKLILIPQENTITATIGLTYTITCNNESETMTPENVSIDITKLEEGVYHYLLASITKSGLFVENKVSQTWDMDDVDYEFE